MEVRFCRSRKATIVFCLGLSLLWTAQAQTAREVQRPRTQLESPNARFARSPAVPAVAGRSASPAPPNSASAASPVLRGDLDDKHKIRPGDKLSYRVDEDREEAKVLPVTDSGEIELPFNFGRFAAANKTCRMLAQEIKTVLEKEYYNRASVHIGLDTINNVRGKAYVSGQVAKRGPVTIPTGSPLKLSQAILLTEPTQWAKLSEVRVVRQVNGAAQTFKINVDAILNGGKLADDIDLEPDDLVIVPERGVIF